MQTDCRSMVTALAVACVIAGLAPVALAAANEEPASPGGPASFRRLNEAQYTRSIDDIFGPGIRIPGRFDPGLREEGLLAIGDSKAVVSASGLEQYELRARIIAAQVLAEDRRKSVLACTPAASSAFDRGCASQFLGQYGRLLLRRPLDRDELAQVLTVARQATERSGSFYQGLELGLARLLMSPYFIFRVERSERDVTSAGGQRLDDYSLAARISFLLWDAPPDTELLDAATSGALRLSGGVDRQVERMLASPRFEQGVRSFFTDMFAYDQFDGLSKDQSIFPKYSSQLGKDAQEQILRTIVDVLVTRQGDYRELFSTRRTFLNRNLAALYKVPVDMPSLDGWVPYTFAAGGPRAGMLTLAGFLMLDPSHEGRSSPTIRGKMVREQLLCQKVPPPPPNVNFNIVQDTHNPLYKTARQRLNTHRDNPSCAGCHSITDPIGLGMENYDAIGDFRAEENGATIDASGTLEGKTYRDLISLEQILHDSPGVTGCVTQRVYEYGTGRAAAANERAWLDYVVARFADSGYAFPALMRTIATSKAFGAVAVTAAAAKATSVASN
jgi:Protein of unknown function (DUF1592)/Protein of unknown function (DUF1588)/Protein of unknown function (DUF1595)/Protein of unknown function (DUF1585)/Protein of unknown function (DUF1587)